MDSITLTAITRELTETLVGGRVQAVVQPDDHSLAMEVFGRGQRHWLLLDASKLFARVHLLSEKARRGREIDSPFMLHARKYLRGARLDGLDQPAWERILRFRFIHPEEGSSTLVAEIMGRWSNLLLLDEQGDIRDSLQRFGANENRYRTVLPGKPYFSPPPQRNKQPIDLVTLAAIERLLNQTPAKEPLWRVLLRDVTGVSPLATREIIYRATGTTKAGVSHPNALSQNLFDALVWFRNLPQKGGWSPSVALDAFDNIPAAFAPYQLSHLDQLVEYPSISQAADVFYAATIGADSYAGRRRQVQALLNEARKKLTGRRLSLGEQSVSEDEVVELRSYGEWILAYTWQIQPGDTELLANTGEEVLQIPIDPTLSGSENAQVYFARYKKAKKAAAKVPRLLAVVDRDLSWLDQLQTDLDLADNAPQIEELREALFASGLVSEGKGKRQAPMQRSQTVAFAI